MFKTGDKNNRRENLKEEKRAVVKTPGLLLLYILAFLMASGFTVQGFAAVFHLSDILDAGPGAVGRATGIQGLAYLAGCFLFPLVQRRNGLSRDFLILLFAAPLLTGFTFLFYSVSSVALATVILAGTGLATAFLWPPLMGVVSSLAEGPDLNRVMARYNLSWTLGPVLMPMIAGALYMQGSLFAFSAAALLFAAGGVIYLGFFFFRRDVFSRAAENRESRDKPENESESLPPEVSDERILREYRLGGWILLFSENVIIGFMVFILPLSLRTDTGLNEFSVGAVVFARSVLMTAGMWVFGHLDFWHFNRKTAGLMVGIFIFLLFGMILFQDVVPLYISLIALSGITAAYFYSSGVFHGVARASERSRRMAVSESMITGGMFVGAAFGGTLYQARGFDFTLYSIGGVLLLGTLIALIVVHKIEHSAKK